MYEIIAVRLEPSSDGSHMHIELVGYDSGHMPGEPIMIPSQRVIQRTALGERFWVVVDGERVDAVGGACPTCGFEPYLVTTADKPGDEKLLHLPEA